jgi:drug/metabolite transporter (DMT)-like permease
MRNKLLLAASVALTILCWGTYGPILRMGQVGMSTVAGEVARLRPFVCVGLAYFLIGVIVPSIWLQLKGEKGEWTLTGIVWSLAGGALGAIGALGIVLAFTFGGAPLYVMPLVFGGAPVVNAFLTIFLAGRMKDIGPVFLAGLVMVILGAVTVLVTGQHAPAASAAATATATVGVGSWVSRLLAIALALVSWGAYGPVLHKGQAAMQHSRLRPLLCVGLAYFAIAVVVPYFFLGEMGENSSYLRVGTLWALAGGACGAIGALGIIWAFNFGGKPVYVMPLVFGGAPVVTTMWSGHFTPWFLAGLILVIAGAVMVLVFAPRGDAPAAKSLSEHPATVQ